MYRKVYRELNRKVDRELNMKVGRELNRKSCSMFDNKSYRKSFKKLDKEHVWSLNMKQIDV